jgi:hypothetical protein
MVTKTFGIRGPTEEPSVHVVDERFGIGDLETGA